MAAARALVAWLTLGSLLACAPTREPESARGEALGDAAALVDGQRISLAEVQHLCEVGGLSPRAALERLVSERLLAQYAERRGYGELRAVERELARARVQALLEREIEAPGSPTGVEARRSKLERWLAVLRKQAQVKYDQSAIQKAFAQASE